MKKLILLALVAMIMAGCGRKVSSITDDADIVIIDSCEYVKNMTNGYFYVYAHKGNCKFCKERRQKELEELVIRLKEK